MMEAPSASIVAAAHEQMAVMDGEGRRLKLRRLDAIGRLQLFKALGSELAHNEPYLGMALLAASVAEIDTVPYPIPATEGMVENMVRRLGDHGLAAVAQALRPEAPPNLDAAKNSAGTPI